MIAVKPSLIREIDAYAEKVLAIPTHTLMARAGEAVARAVLTNIHKKNARVLILCGGGNNGGDGYAAGKLLMEHGCRVSACDLFSAGQRTEEGKRALQAYLESPDARMLYGTEALEDELAEADCVVEAVYGAGARFDLPTQALLLLNALHAEKKRREGKGEKAPLFVSVDCPLGVDSESGRAREEAFPFDLTVELTLPKIGTHSYPAARYAGKTVLDTLTLPIEKIIDNFYLQDELTDEGTARHLLPLRESEGHKGSFGTLTVFTGSSLYRGAAYLTCESALRGGIGLLRYYGERTLCESLVARIPEAVCHEIPPIATLSDCDAKTILAAMPKASALLIGSGCGKSEGLVSLLRVCLESEGAPLVLDADALNLLADRQNGLLALLQSCKRQVLLTPHPLEFARLAGLSVEEVQENRLALARAFAEEQCVTLLLKGKGSVIDTPDGRVCINTSGNTALAKGGSGDVLAGLVASYAAQGLTLFDAAVLGAYLHGRAGETLSETLGEAGVLPSDLPIAIAKAACALQAEGK